MHQGQLTAPCVLLLAFGDMKALPFIESACGVQPLECPQVHIGEPLALTVGHRFGDQPAAKPDPTKCRIDEKPPQLALSLLVAHDGD